MSDAIYVAAEAPAFVASPHARAWAAQALLVHRSNAARAANVLSNFVAFRARHGWPRVPPAPNATTLSRGHWRGEERRSLDHVCDVRYRLDAAPLERALRSNMHWVLPGKDARGRRVVVYNATALKDRAHKVADLQQMLCLLLERLCADDDVVRRGIVARLRRASERAPPRPPDRAAILGRRRLPRRVSLDGPPLQAL